MRLVLCLFACSLGLLSCEKPNENFSLEGKTIDASSGMSLPYVTVLFEQKALINGVFTDYFLEAASATTDGSGNYKLEWKKESIIEAQLAVSREYYYAQEMSIAPDDLRGTDVLSKNIALWPESNVLVSLTNLSGASTIQFNWVETNFVCSCCTNETRTFQNLSDTVFQCNVYGGKWLKYNCVINSTAGTEFLLDSLFCLPFQTNNLMLTL